MAQLIEHENDEVSIACLPPDPISIKHVATADVGNYMVIAAFVMNWYFSLSIN